MKVKFYKTETTYKNKTYKILTPFSSPLSTYVDISWNIPTVFADKTDFIKMASFFVLAAKMKDVIFYLPCGANQLPDSLKELFFSNGPIDFPNITICHHSIQLGNGAWQNLRKRLSKEKLISFEVNPMTFADLEYDDSFYYRQNQDVLDVSYKSGNLFVVGSPKVFQHLAKYCNTFLERTYDFPYFSHLHLDDLLRHGKFPHHEDMQLIRYDEKLYNKWLRKNLNQSK